jgi:hypothetical protein
MTSCCDKSDTAQTHPCWHNVTPFDGNIYLMICYIKQLVSNDKFNPTASAAYGTVPHNTKMAQESAERTIPYSQ